MALTDLVIMPGTDYQAICDAVRAKTGDTALLKSGDIAAQIESIQGGGGGAVGDKVLFMDAALLDAGGAYPVDADDYTLAIIPSETTYVDLDVFDNLPNVKKVALSGNCDFETYSVYNAYRKIYLDVPVFSKETCGVTDLIIKGRETIEKAFLFWSRALVNLTIDNCGDIGDYAVQDCDKLESVTFKNFHGTSIGNYAFFRCTSLKEIVIPEGVTHLGSYSFNNCSNLKTVTLPASYQFVSTSNPFTSCPKDLVIRGYAGSGAEELVNHSNNSVAATEWVFEAIE